MTTAWMPYPGTVPLARRLWLMLRRGAGGLTEHRPVPSGSLLSPVDELYHARRLSLVRLAILLVDDLATAEDIVQDVFAALCRRHGRDLDGVADPHAYLTAGVMNGARSALRRRRTARAYNPPPPGTAPAAEDAVLRSEGDREVLDALRGLPVRQRQVMALRYWSELSEQEIADTLRISPGTVKSTASRALKALRTRLGENR
jgi:RNA polymerase sigma-70 factor (sigma-E family)